MHTVITMKQPTTNEANTVELAKMLNAALLDLGIDLAWGSPVMQGTDQRGTTRIEMYFDGIDTAAIYKLITILQNAKGK